MPQQLDDIEAIVFDVDNTLLHLDYSLFEELDGAEEAGVDEEAVRDAELKARRSVGQQHADGTLEGDFDEAYFRAILDNLGFDDDDAEAGVEELVELEEERGIWDVVRKRTEETLDELLRRDFRIAVLANGDGWVSTELGFAGIDEYFEFVIDSDEVEVEKPNPEIFQIAVDRLDLDPSKIAYVGDVPEVDVAGAREAGLVPVLFDELWEMEDVDCSRIDEHPKLLNLLPRRAPI